MAGTRTAARWCAIGAGVVMTAGILTPAARAEEAPVCAEPAAGESFRQVSAAAAGVDPDKLAEAMRFGTSKGSFVLQVLRRGCRIGEFSAVPELTTRTPMPLASATKGVAALVVGRAITLGMFGLDDPLSTFFPTADAAHGRLTVRQILTQTGGLKFSWGTVAAALLTDEVGFALSAPPEFEPGTTFQYSQAELVLLPKIIEITTGQRFTDFAQRELMDPLGIPRDHWIWAQDANGNTAVNGGMLLRPEDLTRLGQLMVQRGRWRDRQLISADYIAEAGTGTAANGGYGFLMWSNSGDTYKMAHLPDPKVFAHPAFPGAPRDLFAFEGALGQFNVVIPSLDMVIVRMGIPWTIDPASPQTPFAAEINPDNKEFIRRVAAAVTDVEPQPYDDPYRYGDSAGPLLRDLADIQVMLDPVGLASVLTGLGPYAIPHCNLLSCYGNLLPVNLFRQTLDLLQQLAAALAAAMR